ncbi:MAG TPA: cell division protein ZapA [Bacteroidales bacterium]|jgi:cell division protein ZapA|nr:cell division protein ZapA [Bacteroidales bacterium]MDD4235357.1 cell division protein ZapA [Bacteroidales bacterium]MDY0160994.1 cell division protein ZapA [Bacteroidales bacterium]HXK81432.1 cell division protein ZapA [Bacteroidales bacterium]
MEDKSIITININLQGRNYPVKIARGDGQKEELIRKAANKINELVLQFKKKGYKDRDDQDYLAMVTLQFAVQALSLGGENELAPVLNKIRNLDRIIEEVIEEE